MTIFAPTISRSVFPRPALYAALGLAGLLSACGSNGGAERSSGPDKRAIAPPRERMIGQKDDAVSKCLGKPIEMRTTGNRDIWFYEAPLVGPGPTMLNAAPPRDYNAGADPARGACVMQLVFTGDTVTDISYFIKNNGMAGDRNSRCAFIAKQCD